MFDTSVVTISLVCGDPMMFHYKFAIDYDLLLSIYNCHLVSIHNVVLKHSLISCLFSLALQKPRGEVNHSSCHSKTVKGVGW
jgi:hypothetical protein